MIHRERISIAETVLINFRLATLEGCREDDNCVNISSDSGVAGGVRASERIPELAIGTLLRYLRRELCQ